MKRCSDCPHARQPLPREDDSRPVDETNRHCRIGCRLRMQLEQKFRSPPYLKKLAPVHCD
jgi:hypothetical protein